MRNKIFPTRCHDKCRKFEFNCTISKMVIIAFRASSVFPRSILNPLIQLFLISSIYQVAVLTYFLLISCCFNPRFSFVHWQGTQLKKFSNTTSKFTISLCSAFEYLSPLGISGIWNQDTDRCLTITENIRGGQWVKLWLILLVSVISWYFQSVTSASIGRLLTSETEIMKTQKNKYSYP